MKMRLKLILALATAIAVVSTSIAVAHPGDTVDDGAIDNGKATHGHDAHDQHGGTAGHIDVENYGVNLVSKLRLSNVTEGNIADVGVFNQHAYLADWGGAGDCKNNGVHVVDIANVAQPREVAFIKSKEGSYPGEGVQALHIDTPAFNGDILVTNNEKCVETTGFGGLNIYNVTTPSAPTELAVGFGDDVVSGTGKKDAHEIHSVFAWDAGAKAYAVIVDNEEAVDVDIMDITDPTKPFLLAEYDLNQRFPQIIDHLGPGSSFLHDMIVKQINGRFVMLLSYWDGGYVTMDVTNPLNPTYIGDSDFANPDPEAAESGLEVKPEGNAHQAEFSLANDYVIAADEDFGPYALSASTDDGTALTAAQGSDTPKLEQGDSLSGQAVFFGRGCPGDPMAPAGDGTQIAVVERGLCTFTEKVASVESVGGYKAVFIFNRTGSDGCDGSLGMSVAGNIPAFGVAPRSQGFGIFDLPYDNAACLAGAGPERLPVAEGTKGDTLSFSSYFDGWGYVHLYRNGSGKLAELDTYAIPEAHDPAKASGFGDLSVHEVAMSEQRNDIGYLSYYAGGVRAVQIVKNKKTTTLKEIGAFIDDGGNNFWGVQTFSSGGKEYFAASDRDFGLYIFEVPAAN
jgi:hypothetical protein